ncbi:2-hydroxyacid dehydrogenase [Glycomyces lechevalierae]|uniref:2-hydroxyacid dehydrogenase n=1 Tax=Glycomyces lechevalierae TaxID=256034 RepID=A0A9X3PK46_9ACTN|nr:2-hydroxyacid dehydrogenase [Glycomyces lechevalierae]MDA1385271.1 2-hydroxyacid dehydrogenase [Glycomyces lechevalierae]MDR7337112.1 phosphoglycerate dehydrogenase-like enzyme [Glycomyces lechevalierae]
MAVKVWIAHEEGRALLGPLPDGVEVEVYDGRGDYPSDPAALDFWVPPFLAQSKVTTPLRDMTSLKAIQLLSAGAEVWVPAVPPGVTLCDARGVHTGVTAEWTLGAVIASMRGFDVFARKQTRHEWKVEWTTTVVGKRALIVGAGDIGEKVADVLTVLGVEVEKVARRARPGVHPIDRIDALLPDFDVVILILPLTDATRGLVDAKFLARMKDGALLVNAARGPIVDTDALVAEVASGRLRCAVDVVDPEPLPADHPLWDLEGALITPHAGASVDGTLDRAYAPIGAQIRRFAAGEPLENVVSDGY